MPIGWLRLRAQSNLSFCTGCWTWPSKPPPNIILIDGIIMINTWNKLVSEESIFPKIVCFGNYQVQIVGDSVDPLKSSLIIKAKKIVNSMGV